MCRKQPACKAFTFVKEWEANCFLKERRSEESEFQGAISGTLAKCEESDRQQLVRRPSIDIDATGGRQRLPQPTRPQRLPQPTENSFRRQPPATRRPPIPLQTQRPNFLAQIPTDPPRRSQSQFLNRFVTAAKATTTTRSPLVAPTRNNLRGRRPPQLPAALVPSAPVAVAPSSSGAGDASLTKM